MKPLLLVVENDSGTRRLLDLFLRRESFEVDPVATGNDALLLIEHVDYAAVVLDLLIPGRTGRDVLSELAASRPQLLERIVVISSSTEAHLRDVHGSFPSVAVLRKPFDLTELLTAVRERAARQLSPLPSDSVQSFIRYSVTAGAKAGIVARRAADALHLVASFGYPIGVAEVFYPMPLDAQYPICAAARHGRAVWMSTLHAPAAATEYPLLVPVWREHGSFALAAVPIKGGGVVAWSFAEPRVFDDGERARLMAIADAAGELIDDSTTAASRGA